MQKKYIFNISLIAAFLVAGFVVLNNSTPPQVKTTTPEPAAPATCCEKSTQPCTDTRKRPESPTTLDNLSQQFISISDFIH